jgi:DNA-binding NarL/FixJ family response regulator
MVLGSNTEQIANRIKEAHDAHSLNEHQMKVLDALYAGMSHMQIARTLGTADSSVSICISRMRKAFGVPESTHKDPILKRLEERNMLIAAWQLFKKQNAEIKG